MRILGVNAIFHDPAAALVIDGKIVAAAEEERFNRRTHGKRPVPFSAWELPEQSAGGVWTLPASARRTSTPSPTPTTPALVQPDLAGLDRGWEDLRTTYARRAPHFLATALPGLDPAIVQFVPHHGCSSARCHRSTGVRHRSVPSTWRCGRAAPGTPSPTAPTPACCASPPPRCWLPPQLPAAVVFAGWFDRPIQVGGRCAGRTAAKCAGVANTSSWRSTAGVPRPGRHHGDHYHHDPNLAFRSSDEFVVLDAGQVAVRGGASGDHQRGHPRVYGIECDLLPVAS